jgi:hypothetical protein
VNFFGFNFSCEGVAYLVARNFRTITNPLKPAIEVRVKGENNQVKKYASLNSLLVEDCLCLLTALAFYAMMRRQQHHQRWIQEASGR